MRVITLIQKAFFRRLFGITLIIAALAGVAITQAQPTNYCIPYPKEDFSYNYCYSYYYGYISQVRVYQSNSGDEAINRSSGDDNCYTFTGIEGDLKLGNTYTIEIQGYTSYYWYPSPITRAFVDWNQDGDFIDQGEYLGSQYNYLGYGGGYWTSSFQVQVGCDVPIGRTRIRTAITMWYDNGSDACANGYVYPPYYNYAYGEMEDYVVNFIPDIESTFPDQEDILFANEIYNGETRQRDGVDTEFPKPSVTMGSEQPQGAILRYRIVGPLPSTQVVYEALDPVTGLTDIDMGGYRTYEIQRARGTYASNDGSFRATSGGEYRVVASISGAGCPGDVVKVFTVAWSNDLTARDIVSPRTNVSPRFFKYLRGNTIRITGLYQNTGLNDITQFNARAVILGPAGDTVYNQQISYDTVNPGQQVIRPSQKVEVEFSAFRSNEIGVYRMFLYGDLLNAVDQEDFNDRLPRQGDAAYTFEISHEIQLQANAVLNPLQNQTLIGNRPIIPIGEFRNVGVGDASDIPAKLVVTRLQNNQVVYESNIVVQDVPSGKYNTKSEFFDPLTLRETGNYRACLIITHPDDIVRIDDTTCVTFSVQGGLAGTYTVGRLNMANNRNFPTIDSAMNALYYRGLAGSVVFELTDNEYTVQSARPNLPAWDFSSFIINSGLIQQTNVVNSITWRPSALRALTRGGVTIHLVSGNGKGIVFGQSIDNANQYSVFNEFRFRGSLARRYANSNGYITFDGGNQKSLRFVMHSNSNTHAAPFYLARGSQNITIKNVIIENASQELKCNTWLPMTVFSPLNGFVFQEDTLVAGSDIFGYSAGIVMRATLLRNEQAQTMNLDTIPNSNNIIQGNDISGFGYGIMSIGLGQLLIERTGNFQRFYNINNTITGNIIHDICRAGIFLGYEERSNVTNNRIYGISAEGTDAAGIMAGGGVNRDYKGYNNVSLSISGNEVSGVSSDTYSAGIRVEQDRNTFPHATLTQVHFPDVADSLRITNNAVWGITVTDANADRAGIHLFTDRLVLDDFGNEQNNAGDLDLYISRDNVIGNNTILVSPDGGIMNRGMVVGIAAQQAAGLRIINNAIAMLDTDVDPSSPVNAAIFYQGVLPDSNTLISDRNAFWIAPGSNASIYRFVEMDSNNMYVDAGSTDDFRTLQQWQVWTGQDLNSVVGNFTTDLTWTGSDPNRRLRINMNPQAPLGSILNNRGERIGWLTTDLEGNVRGAAGQRYDIGAFEFVGRMYVSDVEVSGIFAPAAYQSGSGTFSDAEYIMTTSPVDIVTRLRNNGSIQQSGIDVTVRIYRENPDGSFSATPIVERVTEVNIASTESVDTRFNLADNQNPDFAPQTYAELRGQGYTVPARFVAMETNVTPRYRIEIRAESDQQNINNVMTKEVRFYLQRSNMNLLVSGENIMTALGEGISTDIIAGRLNADSLISGFNQLGWISVYDSARIDFDLFDRNAWEEKAVDYSMYRTMFWSDGDDEPLTRYQRRDLRNFLNAGTIGNKRNLAISSQEMARIHGEGQEMTDQWFVRNVLSAESISPGNPLGDGVSNDSNAVIGVAVGRGIRELIKSTEYPGDQDPMAGLVGLYAGSSGLTQPAYYYVNHAAARADSLAGVANSTFNRNVIYVAVDWRHWGNIESVLRSMIDYFERNGGVVIPVELLAFDAKAGDNRVDISWVTASEINSDRFIVEKAEKKADGLSMFAIIAEETAAGTSSYERHYGPVVDRNVNMGNTYVYRLKMIDRDGSWEYSREVEVSLDLVNGIGLTEAMPNPASNVATFSFTLNEASDNIDLGLYDMAGRKIMSLFSGKATAGLHEVKVDVGSLTSGSYTYILHKGEVSISRRLQVIK